MLKAFSTGRLECLKDNFKALTADSCPLASPIKYEKQAKDLYLCGDILPPQIKMDTKSLKFLGLTENDFKIYESILRGNYEIRQICLYTKIHRRNVYDCLNKLTILGLISFTKEHRKNIYIASPPEKFLDLAKYLKEDIDKTEARIRSNILNLNKQHVKTKKSFSVQVFIGKEGLKNIYNDILKTEKDFLGFGPGRQLEKIMKVFLYQFIKERIKRKIRLRSIYEESSREFKFTKNPLLEVRYLPDNFCSHAALRVYGNKTVIMLLDIVEPLVILIENKEISDGYRKYFEVLWNSAKS
jgi:sugar-specific transcriptional regulator TrmB